MDLFSVQSIHDKDYSCIVFINAYITPFEIIDEINKRLIRYCKKGDKVIFDLLLYRGNGNQRYIEATYDEEFFLKGSFKPVSMPKKSYIRKISTDYYKNNLHLLDCSILNDPQRQLISKGLVI